MLEVSHGEKVGTPLDVGSVVATAPYLVIGVDERLRVTFAAGPSVAGLPSAAALNGPDGDVLLRGWRELVEVLRRGVKGRRASTVMIAGAQRVAVHAEPLRPGRGAVALCMDLDGTVRALRRSEQGLRMLFRQVPAGIWATDEALRITRAEGSLLDQVPVRLRPVVGRTVWQIAGERTPSGPAVSYHLAALAGRPGRFRFQALGHLYDVFVEPLRDASGEVTGCVGFAVDATEQVARETLLRRLERRLESAQRLAHVGSWEFDLDSGRIGWSAELKRIMGLSRDPVGYEGLRSLIVEEDRALVDAEVNEAIRTRRPFQYDCRVQRPDGDLRMLQTRGEVLVDDQGRPKTLLGSCIDVTERWRTLEARQRTVSLLSATLESTADGLVVVGLDQKVKAFNRRFCELWGLPESLLEAGDWDAVLAAILPQLTDPGAARACVAGLQRDLEGEAHDAIELLDGRIFRRYSQPQRLDGQVVGRVWSFLDVTERERLLRNAELMSTASRLLVSLEVEEAAEAACRAAIPLLGCACALDLFEPEGSRRLFSLTSEGQPEVRLAVTRSTLSGHPRIERLGARTRLSVPLMAGERLVGTLSFLSAEGRRHSQQDVELAGKLGARIVLAFERDRLYRQAREALDAREQFLSVAAHELRGPATTLHLGLQLLRSGGGEQALQLCERQLQQLGRLIDEMLDFTHLRSQRMHFQVESVDLAEATRLTVASLSRELEATGSTVTLTAPASLVGRWDAGRIEQLLRNLLSNAIKYGLGRPIVVELSARGDEALLVVRDQGIGIAHDRQALVFEPFERAVSERNYGGLGLGLFLCRAIVHAFGGTIALESEPEVGSTFRVTLPRGEITT